MPNTWPPTLEHIVQFIGYMSVKEMSDSTARTYIAGIAYQLKINNDQDITQNFLIRKLLEGYRRKNKTKDSRLPITANILSRILQCLPNVCTNNYETKLFAAAYSTAYFGFFRVGEITSINEQTPGHAIQMEDVELDHMNRVVRIKLKHSKVDQLGKSATVLIKNNKLAEGIKPFELLDSYMKIRPKVKGNFFCHFGGKPLTRYQFTAILTKTLNLLGLDFKKYKSHSFRIGAVTNGIMSGMTEDQIQEAGRWKSKAYKTYIRI